MPEQVITACGKLDHLYLMFQSDADNLFSGRAYSPRLLFTWPNAKTSVMGAEQLSSVMEAVGKQADPALKARIEHESEATFGSARLWDDGIIPPEHTRRVLGMGLQMACGGQNLGVEKESTWGVFRM